MRIEFVIDIPGVHNPDAIDAVRVANEAVRLVRNDTGTHAELIHVAVGQDIAVPRDYDPEHPVLSVESTDIVHDPSASSPYVHPFVDHDDRISQPRQREEERIEREAIEDLVWDEAHAFNAEVNAYHAAVKAEAEEAARVAAEEAAEAERVEAERVAAEEAAVADEPDDDEEV